MTLDDQSCLLIGNSFANTMQFVVSITAVFVLLFHKIFIEDNTFNFKSKIVFFLTRKRRHPYVNESRTWKVWFMDNFKQGSSSAIAHIYATYVADQFSQYAMSSDPCIWFLFQFLIDTCIGVALSFAISKGSIWILATSREATTRRWLTIGNYNTMSPRYYYRIWAVQVFHWVICSFLARIICTAILVVGMDLWTNINMRFSDLWSGHRHAELVFVVLAMPIIMNSLQFLLQNWYLKWRRPPIGDGLTIPINNETPSDI